MRMADRVLRLIAHEGRRHDLTQGQQNLAVGSVTGPGVIDYQQVVILRQALNGRISEFLQRALLPGDFDFRAHFAESLRRRDYRDEAARMIPGDAA